MIFKEIGIVKPMAEIAPTTCSGPALERKVRPQKDQASNCPRCHSTHTKFCYYNNYSLSQPRYFCKTCRRYWTEGGSLRNVPVGGGSRKNKRSISSSSTSLGSSHKLPDLNPPNLPQFPSQNPKIHEGHDLNLAFPAANQEYHGGFSQFLEFPKVENNNNNNQLNSSSCSSSTSTPLSALELFRSTGIASRGLNPFTQTPMPDANMIYTSGFPFQEFKPTLGFSVDGLGTRYGGTLHGTQENGGRLMFPFGTLKQFSSTSEADQNKGQGNSTGYWNGMFGGGSW